VDANAQFEIENYERSTLYSYGRWDERINFNYNNETKAYRAIFTDDMQLWLREYDDVSTNIKIRTDWCYYQWFSHICLIVVTYH
jgi:hypothetical protein